MAGVLFSLKWSLLGSTLMRGSFTSVRQMLSRMCLGRCAHMHPGWGSLQHSGPYSGIIYMENTCSEQIINKKQMLRTDYLQETHAQNRLSTGITCSEQIICRKHMLRTDHLQETNAQNRSSTGNSCSEQIIYRKHTCSEQIIYRKHMIRTDHPQEIYMLRTDHLQETYMLRTDHLQEKHSKNR